jgi:hypothetical protein
MKAIIDGKRYDTETAEEIGSFDYGHYPGSGDFSHWSATLYQTKAGTFFLHGEGGALTRFAQHCADGGSCGGEKIIPLDADSALQWAENFLDAEIIEKYFASQIVDA